MNLSPSLHEFVKKVFTPDAQKRPRASELNFCEFLATDAEILDPTASSRASVTSLAPVTPIRFRHNSLSNSQGTLFPSRYQQDFVVEAKLGKGGFGDVFKVRKKLDGQFYAVKRIMQKPSSATLTEILKEVRLLSQ